MTDDENPIISPEYYQEYKGFEVIDVTEQMATPNLGQVAKYLLRAGKKGDMIEDLRKCRWYLEREIIRQTDLEFERYLEQEDK